MARTVTYVSRFQLPHLIEWRALRMLSQAELASLSNVGVGTIVRLEHGTAANGSTVKKIAAGLGIEPSELLHSPPQHAQ